MLAIHTKRMVKSTTININNPLILEKNDLHLNTTKMWSSMTQLKNEQTNLKSKDPPPTTRGLCIYISIKMLNKTYIMDSSKMRWAETQFYVLHRARSQNHCRRSPSHFGSQTLQRRSAVAVFPTSRYQQEGHAQRRHRHEVTWQIDGAANNAATSRLQVVS